MNDENIPPYYDFLSLNSILMSSLYSEVSRDLIINKAKKWIKLDEFKSIILKIVNKNKNKEDISSEIALLDPTKMFFDNLYFLKDEINKKNFITNIKQKNIKQIVWIDDFIIDFYRSLNISCLDIYYTSDKVYSNLYKFINWNLNVNGLYSKSLIKYSGDRVKFEMRIPNKPDVLIVFHNSLNNNVDNYISTFDNKFLNNFECDDKQLLSNKEIREEISYNGEKYVLDSVLLKDGDKSIVGFKYEGEKYVYNNHLSLRYDYDENKYVYNSKNPCSLMKFNWEFNKGDFCYNPYKCEIEYEDDIPVLDDICFNFENGNKTLIYIKKQNKELLEIPDIEILKVIKEIKEKSLPELVTFIKRYDNTFVSTSGSKLIALQRLYLKYFLMDYSNLRLQVQVIPETQPISQQISQS